MEVYKKVSLKSKFEAYLYHIFHLKIVNHNSKVEPLVSLLNMLYEHKLETVFEELLDSETHPVNTPSFDLSIAGFPLLLKWGFSPDMLNLFEMGFQSYAAQTRTHFLSLTNTLAKITENPFDHTPRSLIKQYRYFLFQTTQEWETILNTFHLTAKELLPPLPSYEIVERKALIDNPFFSICPKETFLIFTTDYLHTLVTSFNEFRKKEKEYESSQRICQSMKEEPELYEEEDYKVDLRVACQKKARLKREMDKLNEKMEVLATPVLEESERLKKEEREEARREMKRKQERRERGEKKKTTGIARHCTLS